MIPLSGLLPLEGTMPGWPEAPETSIAPTLFLVFGIPLIIGLIITFLCKGRELRQRSVENGVAVGLPVSNRRRELEGTDRQEDRELERREDAEHAARAGAEVEHERDESIDASTADNPAGSRSA